MAPSAAAASPERYCTTCGLPAAAAAQFCSDCGSPRPECLTQLAPPAAAGTNGFAVASLVLGIVFIGLVAVLLFLALFHPRL